MRGSEATPSLRLPSAGFTSMSVVTHASRASCALLGDAVTVTSHQPPLRRSKAVSCVCQRRRQGQGQPKEIGQRGE